MKLLANRYQIEQQLGKKAGRQTFLALDLHTQDRVVVKLLTFSSEFEWDDLKLFEREAATLKELFHPAIPRYLNYFEVNEPDCKGFALVQTYIEARSLEQHLKSGRTFSEEEVKQLAEELLKILGYLHDRQPPVIHRDLKPSNILLSDRSGNHPGHVYLVDFGAVQSMVAKEGGTMTIVGTYGYMPPEQFGGRATPASDLYSLGATLIYLVTGQHPANLPQDDLRIQFEEYTTVSPGFVNWLKRMTEPSAKKRFSSSEEALTALKMPYVAAITVQQPPGSQIQLTKTRDRLEIVIPPQGFHPSLGMTIPFAIAWNSFLVMWTSFALMAPFPINLVVSLFSLPFWTVGIGMIIGALFTLFGSTRLIIDRQKIAFIYELFGIRYSRPRPQPRQTIDAIVYTPQHFTKDSEGDRVERPAKFEILANSKAFSLMGNDRIVNDQEREWLAQELSQWLGLPIQRQ
jgi:serine/threonine protein kinase